MDNTKPVSNEKTTSASLTPGEVFEDKFEILELIGRGAKGIVYKAKHLMLGEICALKMLHAALAEDEMSLQRFHREAHLYGQLQHPNIVSVKSYALNSERHPYIVMEYLQGEDLDSFLKKRGRLSFEEAKIIFGQIAGALAFAHEKQIAHRDIKPSNIFITKGDDGSLNCKLIDLGLAKILDAEKDEQQKLTRTGLLTGTPGYMSPEQCKGQAAGPESDIYSLAVVMYEAIYGSPPFKADTDLLLMQSHLMEELKFPTDFQLPAGIRELLSRALSKTPQERPNAKSFQELLESIDATKLEEQHSQATKLRIPVLSLSVFLLAASLLLVYLVSKTRSDADKQKILDASKIKERTLHPITKIGGRNAESYLKELDVLMSDGDYRKDRRMIKEGTELARQAIKAAEAEGNPETIVEAKLEFLSAAKNEPEASLLSRMEELQKFASRHSELAPQMRLRVYKELAELLSESGKYERARELYSAASELGTTTHDQLACMKQIVFCSGRLKDISKMEEVTEEMLKLEKDDDQTAEALSLLASAYAEAKARSKLDSTLKTLQKIQYRGYDEGAFHALDKLADICKEKGFDKEQEETKKLSEAYKEQRAIAKSYKKKQQPSWLRPRSSIEEAYFNKKSK